MVYLVRNNKIRGKEEKRGKLDSDPFRHNKRLKPLNKKTPLTAPYPRDINSRRILEI